jgi:hypothetical protein
VEVKRKSVEDYEVRFDNSASCPARAWLQVRDLPDQLAATAAMRCALAQIKAEGTPINLLSSLLPFDEFLDLIGMPEIRELDRRFSDAPVRGRLRQQSRESSKS